MSLTKEETLFIEFLNSFPQFYKKAHVIAENSKGVSILPMDGEKTSSGCIRWMKSAIHVKYSDRAKY